jgi:hypothetical protein
MQILDKNLKRLKKPYLNILSLDGINFLLTTRAKKRKKKKKKIKIKKKNYICKK